jgi:hypothetical protein
MVAPTFTTLTYIPVWLEYRMTGALAIVTPRNEAPMVRILLPEPIAQGLHVAFVDHASRDETRDLAQAYWGNGVALLSDVKHCNKYSLSDLVAEKVNIADQCKHQ